MTKAKALISTLFLLFFSVWSVSAQEECAFDISSVINRVTEACADIEENQVCYGNRDVTATARVNTIDFVFDNPGDRADLYNIQSLVVDAVGTTEDTWGVAQMRLQIGSETGIQDVNLLLFGRFDIENAVADSDDVALQVRSFEMYFRREPNITEEIFYTVPAGTLLTGVGRLEDSTWLRVEDPITRVVGWVENTGLQLVDESRSIGLLPVQESNSAYYGAMQAFYFENGTTNLGCDTLESDGLIIQTPEGSARISLLINEVSIELTGGEQVDDNNGGTAFVQADPSSTDGMSVNVVEGSATVQTDNGSQTVASGQQSTIPISVDLSPRGEPREPRDVDLSNINIDPFLPTVRNPFAGNNTQSTTANNGSATGITVPNINNSTGNGNGSSNGSGSPNVDVSTSTDNGSGNGTGSTTSQSSTGTSTGSVTIDTSNPFDNPNEDLPLSIDQPPPTPEPEQEVVFITQGNAIALTLAVIAAFILITFIVSYTRRNK